MTVRYAHDIDGGAAWSLRLNRPQTIRLEALGPGACASMLCFSATMPGERLNVPDTLKAQMSACVRAPMVLMSDMGRALLSVTGSSLPWHDALTGHSTDACVRERFGPSSYARDGNGWRRSARRGFLDELWKHGLGMRDLHACVNWFSKVVPAGDDRGTLRFAEGWCQASDWVALRAEQDVLAVFSTAPHVLDPAEEWSPAAVRVTVATGEPPGPGDPSRTFRPEAARAIGQAERLAC
jgi:uncharacterized protein